MASSRPLLIFYSNLFISESLLRKPSENSEEKDRKTGETKEDLKTRWREGFLVRNLKSMGLRLWAGVMVVNTAREATNYENVATMKEQTD
ncbi:unnamed protein product [Dovyalis caffra]|uniref:Uncharacterized protein n=1 Tax=Dovyalis caffra TaxID=77055 RepID=A0AAV1RJX9_9ROSI|nr:unnamed protein product [Dovyalis caffra]